MSGRQIIIILVVSTGLMGVFFYRTLQQSPQHKQLATEQMAAEYSTYTQTFQKVDRLTVAETQDAKFYIPLTPVWKFQLHDKTLIAQVPKLTSEPPGLNPAPEIIAVSKKIVQDSLMHWLEDKYHTKKDLKVEVHLEDEKTP